MHGDDTKWLPYIADRITLEADAEMYLYIKDDDEQGLGIPGRSGKIENYGPGSVIYKISDDGERWSKEITKSKGGWDEYRIEEKVKFHTIHVRASSTSKTVFSVNITAIAPVEAEE